MKKVREDLGEPNSEGCFKNPSRDRIFDASREVGAILAVLELVEREHYRMALPALKDRCEALLSTDELLNERVRTLKYKVKISAKHKVRELPLHAMRARFTEHLDELKKLELEHADEMIRRVMAEISRPTEKTTRKGSRSADKRQMDRDRRNEMKGNTGSKKQRQVA